MAGDGMSKLGIGADIRRDEVLVASQKCVAGQHAVERLEERDILDRCPVILCNPIGW